MCISLKFRNIYEHWTEVLKYILESTHKYQLLIYQVSELSLSPSHGQPLSGVNKAQCTYKIILCDAGRILKSPFIFICPKIRYIKLYEYLML